ncbi:enoyl-CoA hydratase/isomerase family protein [Neobacillus sp. NRS-1170]|uniref:enoyl-CoA hydratase/isomerase family protein n=1 Tax=Neobacillus sp. NRS-1170 TaxID=3233898 RepID=UPI003D2A5600
MAVVNTRLKDGVFEIELNRPEALNSLNDELALGLQEAVFEARDNSSVRTVLIYGIGRGFCAGGDLKQLSNSTGAIENKEFLQKCHQSVLGIYNLEKPVIAAVHGSAVGAGCNLALACDIVIAEENAVFSEVFAKVGAIPDFGGLYFLPQKIGMHKAAELIFTGKNLSAQEALDYGLINEVVSDGQALEKGRELAMLLANGPTKTFGIAKRILHQAPHLSLENVLDLEALGQSVIFQTRDLKEGIEAFIEKRIPKFEGY